ncbi:MAG: tRNA (adenosine(37)-N6)-threonylcarbamoyltransferase complex transferase subunit TsaD [Clostridiales bacterium]|nr:tRNA (adenosine(37)-N6)-threonylcarbamoyltransferase complex transferase subunit TsaD [Clostridiales bacterium]
MKILAIESSCDETAAAVVESGRTVLSSVIASQVDEHALYGGVVPEIASRRHCENIVPIVDKALKDANTPLNDIDAIAVTYAPGLIGALLVGVNYAKGLSMATSKPLIPVHHIKGHIASNYIAYRELEPPFMCLVASGGHSHIVQVNSYTDFDIIGRTRDDAAGEAFDKVARVLGFPYPGGISIDKMSRQGDGNAYKLPHPVIDGSPFDFSFSGLKTAVINLVHNHEQKNIPFDKNDMAASFQRTVCEMLSERLIAAAKEHSHTKIAIAGGVAANSELRAMVEAACDERGWDLYIPPIELCGDNAAMIGSQAYYEYKNGNFADESLNAIATKKL